MSKTGDGSMSEARGRKQGDGSKGTVHLLFLHHIIAVVIVHITPLIDIIISHYQANASDIFVSK